MGQKAARKAYPPLGNWLEQILLNVTISRLTRMVKGRQITDPILIVNGIVDHWRCGKQFGFIIKLDIEKAFDKLNCALLLSMLQWIGFHEKWIKWIHACISSVYYFIIINGRPRGYIKANRGIQQRDLLSPFLFVIAMDYLSSLIEDAQSRGIIQGYKSRDGKIHISHLLFVDDILLFSLSNPLYCAIFNLLSWLLRKLWASKLIYKLKVCNF